MHPEAVDAAARVPHGSADDGDLLDFSANTNPETPPGAREVHAAAFDAARTYPQEGYPAFREAAAAAVDCDPEAVVPTAGGLAAIRLAVATHVSPGDAALVPAPSFGEYAREVRLQGGEPAFVAHDEVLAADPSDHALAVVCSPNNPTGEVHDADALREFARRCREAGTLLLVDEAFRGFTERESVAGTPGTVVARSLTKLYGLPGLRCGYAVATGRPGQRLRAAVQPWALGTAAARVGVHSLAQADFVARTRERIRRERERMRDRLGARFAVRDSAAPFLLLRVDGDVDALLDEARDRGVELRDARTFRGLDSHVRVAVRRPAENDRLLEALDV